MAVGLAMMRNAPGRDRVAEIVLRAATRRRRPLRKAPLPFSAVNNSSVIGL